MPIQEASSSSSARSSAWPAWSSAAREAAASPATAWTSEATAASQPWVSGSAAEVGRLAEAIVPPYELLVRSPPTTGLRAGELAALRVKRLDLLRGTVRVVESASEVGGRLVLGSTKTYAERTVRLPRFLREDLAAYPASRPQDPDGFVFTAPKGGPLRHNNFYQRIFCPALA